MSEYERLLAAKATISARRRDRRLFQDLLDDTDDITEETPPGRYLATLALLEGLAGGLRRRGR